MMMVKDDWMRAAMTDDALVVELLMRLKQPRTVKSPVSVAVALPKWGVRLPRSSLRCDVVSQRKDGDNSTRCSPTTPLSWSGGGGGGGGTSPSGAGDCFEESSRSHADGGRSKGFAATEPTSISIKRSRKKKSYAELKEEETLLLKEKIYLKKELATINTTIKEQRTRNMSLKRMKLDLDLHSTKNMIASTSYDLEIVTSNQPSASSKKMLASTFRHTPSTLPTQAKVVSKRDSLVVLPDLNMMPTEEDSGSEILYGMS